MQLFLPSLLLGLLMGIGVLLIVSSLSIFRVRPLHIRVGELISDVSDSAFSTVVNHESHRFRQRMALRSLRWWRSSSATERSLIQSNSALSSVEFRQLQLLGLAVGALVGFLLGGFGTVILQSTAPQATFAMGGLAVVFAGVGLMVPSRILVRRARARMHRLESELPNIWEFLALAISAGDSVNNSFVRLAGHATGVFATELNRVLIQHQLGMGMSAALEQMATRLGQPSLTRGIDQLLLSFSRGTPIVDVLQALASDARAEQQRRLIESAGKKEVAMLVPLVFLILPVTVIFAIFPGVIAINSSF